MGYFKCVLDWCCWRFASGRAAGILMNLRYVCACGRLPEGILRKEMATIESNLVVSAGALSEESECTGNVSAKRWLKGRLVYGCGGWTTPDDPRTLRLRESLNQVNECERNVLLIMIILSGCVSTTSIMEVCAAVPLRCVGFPRRSGKGVGFHVTCARTDHRWRGRRFGGGTACIKFQ